MTQPEKIFGILADVDDAFLDDVMAIRRARRAAEDDAPGRTDALAASGRLGHSMDLYRILPRAKPEERNAIRGLDPEKIFGICADELDDQFLKM